MHTDARRERINSITEAIIGAAYQVSNELGSGFLEKVYENALAHVLRKQGRTVEQQRSINVWFDEVVVGQYAPDIVVDNVVIVELKAAKGIDDVYVAQCINYLKATGLSVCLLINFGSPRVEVKRIVNNF